MSHEFIVGGVPMALPIMLGAGVAKHPSQLIPYFRPGLPLGAAETGSYTALVRPGNPETPQQWPETWERFQELKFGLNAWGMPNIGFGPLPREILSLKSPIPIILNVAGFSPREYQIGAGWGALANVAAVTLNLGCPNAHDQKTVPIAYDLESTEKILDAVASTTLKKPIWVKLSPYLTVAELENWSNILPHLDFDATPTIEDDFLDKVLSLIVRYHCVRAIIFSNTLGNVVYRRADGTTATAPNDGKAGLSGPLLKNISLGLIQRASSFLKGSTIDLIGCGGIVTGQDVVDYLQAGAKGVQCVSGPSWYGDGPRFFANLVNDSPELQDYLSTHTE